MAEDDGPLLLSHGDVLGVVVPVIAEGIELSLKFVGDGRDEGIIGRRMVVPGAEESEDFGLEERFYFLPDLGSDRHCLGHCGVIRWSWEVVMEGGEGESRAQVPSAFCRSLVSSREGVVQILGYGGRCKPSRDKQECAR